MVRDILQDLKEIVNVLGAVFDDDLEWAEKLFSNQISLLLSSKVLNWHENRGRLVSSVLSRYAVVAQW